MEAAPRAEAPRQKFELTEAQAEALDRANACAAELQTFNGETLAGDRYQAAEQLARELTELLQDPVVKGMFEYQQLQERMTAAANGNWQRPSEIAAAARAQAA